MTTSPGVPSQADLAAYNAARTPQATVVLGTPPTTSTTSSVNAQVTAAINTVQPAATGGVFTQVDLRAAAVSRPRKGGTSGANGTSGTLPALATVTLTYTVDRAGDAIWVQPLNGGTVSVVDGAGKTITSNNGFALEIGPAGTTSFCFQAPAASSTYQVLTRLDNVATVLAFLVPDPNS